MLLPHYRYSCINIINSHDTTKRELRFITCNIIFHYHSSLNSAITNHGH